MQKALLILVLFLAPAILDARPANVTASGTLISSGTGYTYGDAFSVTFTITDEALTFVPHEGTHQMIWLDEEWTGYTDLYDGISGTNISGSWTRPNAFSDDPCSRFEVRGNDREVLIYASSDYETPIGLSFVGESLCAIYVVLTLNDDVFAYDGGNSNLSDYLSDYDGTYAGTNVPDRSYLAMTDAGAVYLDITSLTISTVPEPAHYAMLSGAGLFVAAILARRRKIVR